MLQMPIVKNTLLPGLFKYIWSIAMFCCCLQSNAQGLLFNSNDSLVTRRTSLHVFGNDLPEFHGHLSVSFYLSLWDNANLGYILNIAEKDNSYSLSYLYLNGTGFLNFNIDRKSNKIKIPLDPSMLKKGRWTPVMLDLDLVNDRAALFVDGKRYRADQLGLKDGMQCSLVFGKNQYYTEVPNMAVKDIRVSDLDKSHVLPLDEWKGNAVHDKDGNIIGSVENPVWLINKSYFWKPVYRRSFSAVAGINFDPLKQNLFIFSKDSLITFDPESERTAAVPYSNKLPVPMVLGKSIFNTREDKCYIYELFDIPKGKASIASLDMHNLKWEAMGKTILPQQRHHHNMFYNLSQDSIYLFGGYGGYRYYDKFIKYNAGKDIWEEVPFKGDKIIPRFFAASGPSDNPDEVLIFGGYGNESGSQIVGGRQLYDLYRINLRTHTIKKCWTLHPPASEVFVPANNLVLSPDKKYFYVLCYPHEIAHTALKLYKFSVADGSYEVVSAPIPVVSEKIESDINLFFDHRTNKFICSIQEFTDRARSTIKLYSLLAPPVSNVVYLSSLGPAPVSHPALIYVWIALTAAVIAGGVIIYKRRRRRPEPVVMSSIETVAAEPGKDERKKPNTIFLLGEFKVFDKHGMDVTHLFSPKIKQLFLLILLKSHDNGGVTSKKISSLLWPDKDAAKTKNIKGVTFNHLRNIISSLEGIELVFRDDHYQFKVSEQIFCDYFLVSDLVRNQISADEREVFNHFDILSRGRLLADMSDKWLDEYKDRYDERLIGVLQPMLATYYQAGDIIQVAELARLILEIDPFNDVALKYQLKGLRKLKGIEHSRKLYDHFTSEYERSFGASYPTGFEKLIQ
jgi:two-component SAPR family response regulator